MRNFRGPIRRYPGSLTDSSDDDDNDYDVYLQPDFGFDQDDSDAENGNEADRFAFNLVFNAENGNISSSEEDEEEEEEEEEEDDALIDDDEIIEIDTEDFEDLNDIIGGNNNRSEVINTDQPRSPNSSLPRLSQSQMENSGENPERDSSSSNQVDGDNVNEDEDAIDDVPTPPQPSSPVPELHEDVNDGDEEDDDGEVACFSNNGDDGNCVSGNDHDDDNDYCGSARFSESPVEDTPSSSPDHYSDQNDDDNNLMDNNSYKDNINSANNKMDCTTLPPTATSSEVQTEKDKDSDSSATSSTSSKYRTIIHQFINDLLLAKTGDNVSQENHPSAATTTIATSTSTDTSSSSPSSLTAETKSETTTTVPMECNTNIKMDSTDIPTTTTISEPQIEKDSNSSSNPPNSSKLRTIIHQYIGELVLRANPELQQQEQGDSSDEEENNLNYPEIETLRHSPNPNHDDNGHSPPQENSPNTTETTTSTVPATTTTTTTSSSTTAATDTSTETITTTAVEMNTNNHIDTTIGERNNTTPPPSSTLHCDYSDSSAENTPKKDNGSTKYEDSLHEDQVEEEEEMEEQFCNPMEDLNSHSDGDGDDRNEEALRGDRIGNTTYSERHVLKILMNWVSALPKFQNTPREENSVEGDGGVDPVDSPLSSDMGESMELLWDMSSEADVMHYLIDKNILGLIIDNLDSVNCPTRLKEIALGILANILSCSSILESFPEKDEDLNIVERVVAEGINSSKTSVLTQSFAVLRRVICYIRNAKPVSKWMKLFLSEDFIQATNFLLSSSTNVLLLGDVIIFMFTLLEILSPPNESEEDENHGDQSITSEETSDNYDTVMTKNFEPITRSDFVPSISEGLIEMLKKVSNQGVKMGKIPSPAGKLPECHTTGNGPDENIHDDLIIPRGHVQQGLLNGLASLCYLNKFKAGQVILSQHSSRLMDVLLGLFGKFQFITEIVDGNETLDYFAIAVDLLSFIHKQLDSLIPSALTTPSYVGIYLIEQEEKDKKEGGDESNKSPSQTPISHYKIILYNYFISMEEKFSDQVKSIMIKEGGERLNKFFKDVMSIAEKMQGQSV